MISEVLIPKLQQRFSGRGMRMGSAPGPVAVFPAAHPEVGDVQIYDDGDELTVVAGNFTHGHFSNYDHGLSAKQKAERIVEEVVFFLESLFADRVILWGSHHGGGGWYYAGKESSLSCERGSQYVWSGPRAQPAP